MTDKGHPLRLACVLAHPDDETLGLGGALAKYAAEGVETYVVTATRGQRGRYRDGRDHPGAEELGRIREAELRAAAEVLGVREVSFLDYWDKDLDRAAHDDVIGRIVEHLRCIRPHVIVTFPPDGAYGHPDHIAVSQFVSAAVVAAADPTYRPGGDARAHRCHESQMAIYGRLAELSEDDHRRLWGTLEFYRAMSLVNGGRARENDLFAGLR